MKICPNCNSENRDEAMFCTKCGNKFEEQLLNTNTNAPQNYSTPIDPIPSFAAPVEQPPKKKSKVLIYVLGLVALVAIVFLAINFISNANPANKLIQGLVKMSKMDKVTSTTTVDVVYDGDNEDAELLNDITIKLETAADVNNVLAQLTLDLLYDNKSVIQVAAGVNNEDLYIDLKDLHKEPFYQEIEGLLPEYSDYINDYKIIKKALNEVSLKFDDKKYIKIIKKVLDDDIKASGNKITVTLNSETITELMEKLLEEAEDDKKLMESIRKNAIDFINKVIKEEKKLNMSVDGFEDALETFEDEDEFEDYYKEAIADALDSMDYSSIDIDDIPDMDITFRFGAGNAIKGIDYTAVIEEGGDNIEINVKTDIKSGASFTKINKKDAIEIEELISGGDMEDVAEEISGNLIKAIKKNKELTKKIEELTGEDIEDSIEMMMYGLFSFAG